MKEADVGVGKHIISKFRPTVPRRALGGQLNKNRWLMSQHRSVGHKMGAAFIPNFTQFPRKLFGGTFGFIYESVSYYLSLFIIIISFARHPVSII
jgi:hypothetical protein